MGKLALAIAPLLVLVALIIIFTLTIDRDPSLIPSALIDKPAPQFTLPPVDGLAVPGFATKSLLGSVTLVNVFASWCVPCRDEHPVLMALKQRGDIRLFGINQKDAPENARAFLTELGNPYDSIGADSDGRVSIDWGVYGVPETFVVDKKGVIIFKQIGPISAQSLEKALLPAIEAANKD